MSRKPDKCGAVGRTKFEWSKKKKRKLSQAWTEKSKRLTMERLERDLEGVHRVDSQADRMSRRIYPNPRSVFYR